MLRIGSLALVVGLAAPPAAAAEPPGPRVARYTLAEFRKSVSAGGERASAVRGTVVASGGAARWDLTTGTFPRSTATSFLVGDRSAWLLDRDAPVAARASMDDLRALFVPRADGDSGPFQAAVRDLSVEAAEPAAGPPFQGRATRRHRLDAKWSLVTSSPGRVGRIRTRLAATLDVLEEAPDEARSPLDDASRLFDVPAEALEALAPHLGAIRGWPVRVVVTTEAELSSEGVGGAAGPSEERAPVTVRSEARREVSDLAVRAAAPGEAAALALGEEIRLVGIERLVEPRETLR